MRKDFPNITQQNERKILRKSPKDPRKVQVFLKFDGRVEHIKFQTTINLEIKFIHQGFESVSERSERKIYFEKGFTQQTKRQTPNVTQNPNMEGGKKENKWQKAKTKRKIILYVRARR